MADKRKQYRLKLTSLKFISAVDVPAQESATALLIKSAGDGAGEVTLSGRAEVVKVSDELGIVFAWAMTPTVNGEPYYDLHGDNIDEESMLKAAADFMAGARMQDVQHDCTPDGQVVFGMPMTPDIAKAFGVKTKTTGLMCGLKPSAETLAKFKDGSLTGLSIYGTGIREEVKAKAATAELDRSGAADPTTMKRAVLTSDVEGHAHLLEAGVDSGSTSGTEMLGPPEGRSGWHYHPYVRNEDGSITIGAAMGHTHDVVTAAKAATPTPTAKTATQETTMDPKILKAFAQLTDDQVAHYRTLDAEGQEAFLGKSAPERAAIVKAALDADPVIEIGGRKIRKSQDPTGLIEAAWREAESAKAAATANAEAAAEAALDARAGTVLKSYAGEAAVKRALLKAVEGIADQATRTAALAMLAKGGSAITMTTTTLGIGAGGTPIEGSAEAELQKMAADHAAKTGVSVKKARQHLIDTDSRALALSIQAKAERNAA